MVTPRQSLRFIPAGILALALVGTMGATASAAPPANDDRSAAAEVGTLPYTDSRDTAEATPQNNDPDCFSGAGAPTVWYSFTPSRNGLYGATTRGSDYDTTLLVAARNDGGGLEIIDCSDDAVDDAQYSTVVWQAQAGQEYLIMVGSWLGTPAGALEFRLVRNPRVPRVNVTVANKGTINKFGAAVIRGRVKCSDAGGAAPFVEVTVKQKAGRFIIRGFGWTQARCNQPFRVRVPGNIGPFARGKVTARALAGVCSTFGCGFDEARQTVKLKKQ